VSPQNFLALLPLALLLGHVTEDVSLRCGQLLGGLVNATFGNVVEVILSLAALHQVLVLLHHSD
jgi:Ca2+:H+ antiporter